MTTRYLLVFFALFLLSSSLRAQPAEISGIINTYAPVIGQDYCSNSITLDSAAGFAPGDRVLLIQMQGASFDSSDTPGFGTILDYGSAGFYELGTIAAINVVSSDSTAVIFEQNILNRYNPRGRVQLVRIPRYNDVIVTGTLRAPMWNGRVGGIIALHAEGTVTLNADIDASGAGFFGGTMYDQRTITCGITNYRITAFGGDGALKGAGIGEFPDSTFMGGRGALANGGGGGNNHNSGGGGGGNGGAGGKGGFQWEGCGLEDIGGRGGRALDYANNRIFMGGGAGSGHTNNNGGTDSGHGGGIVILRAGALDGRGRTITVAGFDSHAAPGIIAGQDASSGGGAGGVILADVDRYLSEVFLEATGGAGGNTSSDDAACHGTGGGGGGGVIDLSNATVPAGVNIDVSGGRNGIGTVERSHCFNDPYGSIPGDNGLSRTGFEPVESRTLFEPSSGVFTLPILTADPGDTVIISLVLSENTNLAFSGATRFTARIRIDGSVVLPLAPGATREANGDLLFEVTGVVSDTGSTLAQFPFLALLGTRSAAPIVIETFAWNDSTELICPLFVTRRDGELLLTVCQEGGERLVETGTVDKIRPIAPNPVRGAFTVDYDLREDGPVEIYVADLSGARVRTLFAGAGRPGTHSLAARLDPGEYFVVLRTPSSVVSERLRVMQ